jgi:hypothetical protein
VGGLRAGRGLGRSLRGTGCVEIGGRREEAVGAARRGAGGVCGGRHEETVGAARRGVGSLRAGRGLGHSLRGAGGVEIGGLCGANLCGAGVLCGGRHDGTGG